MPTQIKPSDSYTRFLVEPTRKPAPEHIKRLLSKYRITSFLGAGGFANVYEGTDTDGLNVAIKIPQFQMKKTMDSTTLKKFAIEAQIWTKLHHENIVGIYTTGIKPLPHIVMELMDGGSLDGLMKNHQPTVREAVHIMFQILRGVSYAHQMATVHRDLKPENILFTSDGVVKITDWGIGKYMASEGITKTIETKGTIAYSAPEQFDSREYGKVDWQTDIFQLGILFYDMLTGVKPFDGKGIADVMGKVLAYEPELPSKLNPDVPTELDEIVMGALEKCKDDRWNSSAVMLHELKKVIKGTIWKSGREMDSPKKVKEVQKKIEIMDEVHNYLALLREIDVDVSEYLVEMECIDNYVKLRWYDKVEELCTPMKEELLELYQKRTGEIGMIPATELQVMECNRYIRDLFDKARSKNLDVEDIIDIYDEAMKECDRGYFEMAGEKLHQVKKILEKELDKISEKHNARKEFIRLCNNPCRTLPPEGLQQMIEDNISESWALLNQWEKKIQEDKKSIEIKKLARKEYERLRENKYGLPPPDDLDRLMDEDISRSWEKINEWKTSINEEWMIRKNYYNNCKRSSRIGRILCGFGVVFTIIAVFLSQPSGYHYSNIDGVIEESYSYPGHPLNYYLAFGGLITSLGAVILLVVASDGFNKIDRSNKVEIVGMVISIIASVVSILIFIN